MLFIPGFLISVVTFPGVIVHELAHQLFCYLMRVPVYEVKYFQMKNPCGYVMHEPTDRPLTNFMISIGPFLVNTLVGALILLPTSIQLIEFGVFDWIRGSDVNSSVLLRFLPMLVAGWLGISVLMHAFPSTGDANALVHSILKNKDVNIFVRILVAPVVGLIYVGAIGSVVWLDLGYALLVTTFLPKLVALFL